MDIVLKKVTKPIKKSAVDVFTDRVEPRTAFNESLDAVFEEMQNGKPTTHVLNFYGFGGIGKTTLIDKLREEVSERNKREKHEVKYIDVKLDANKNSRSTPNEIIIKIVDEISNKYGINDFPRTMWAKYVYYTKSGEKADMQFDSKTKNLVGRGINIALELGKCFAPFGAFIELGKGLFENLKADKDLSFGQVKKIFLKAMNGDTEGEEEIEYIGEYTTQDIEKLLPQWFYEDLCSITMTEGPFVFFFDTFEYLTDDITNIDIISKPTEKFLQEVIGHVPYSIWVIAGREKLVKNETGRWGEIDNVEDHFLDKLDRKDLEYYFKYAHIDMSMLDTFMKLSEGIPSIVDFLYDRYIKLYDPDSTETIYPHLNPDNYGTTRDEFVQDFIDRNIRYFKSQSSRGLFYTLLSIDFGWTDEDILWMKPYLKCYDDETYNTIKNLSIIRRTGKTYAFHSEARKLLLTRVPLETKEETAKLLLKYHEEKINASNLNERTEDMRQIAALNLRESAEIFIDTIFDKVMSLIVDWRLTDAEEILESFYNEYRNSDNHKFKYLHSEAYYELYVKQGLFLDSYRKAAECQSISAFLSDKRYRLTADFMLARNYYDRGIYVTAYDVHKKVYDARVREFGENDKDTLESKIYVGRCLSKKGKSEEGLVLHEEAFKTSLKLHGEKSRETVQLLTEIAKDLIAEDRYKEALIKLDEAYNTSLENNGQDTPDTLTILLDKQTCLQCLRRFKEAEPIARYCLEEFVKLGRDLDYKMNLAKFELGYILFCLKKESDALSLFEEVYEFWEKTLGKDSLQAIRTSRAIAKCYFSLGKEDEALKIFNKCYDFFKVNETLGEEHLEAIETLFDIASSLLDQGKKEEALAQFQKVLSSQVHVLGERKIAVAETYRMIALCLYYMGDYLTAIDSFKKSNDVIESITGEKNADLLSIVAGLYRLLNRYDEALDNYSICYKLRAQTLGESNEETLEALYGMAGCFVKLDRYDDALESFRLCYKSRAQVLGESNEKTLSVLLWMGSCFVILGRYDEALENCSLCYRLSAQSLGDRNKITLYALLEKAKCYYYLNKYDEALGNFYLCYKLMVQTLGECNEGTLECLYQIAKCYYALGKIEDAFKFISLCYELRVRTLGEKNEETLDSLYLKATISWYLGSDEALEYFNLCYNLRAQTLGDNHKKTLATLYTIAENLEFLEQYSDALEKYSLCYKIRVQSLGETDAKTLDCLRGIAECYIGLDRYDEALEIYTLCYKLKAQTLGEENSETIECLSQVAKCYEFLDRYDDGLAIYSLCYKISARILGENNKETLYYLREMTNCYKELGR